MRIEAPAVLFILTITTTSTVAADPVSRQEPHLPQFVSPAARIDVVESARASNAAEETRQAAEVLSGKFSDATPPANSAASVDPVNVKATAGVDIRDDPKMQGRVAILVAQNPSESAHAKKTKTSQAKPAALAAQKPAPRKTRVANAGKVKATDHRRSPGAHLVAPHRNASMLASNELPGAQTGWQTGIIGLLTNPTFWH